ncbi:DUF6362 family protein [Nitratireductor sp. XY-223]|uniref:DUF6362 family protein n=1 Tax=Nitratireductor sp. XY-223 TaxID=2561926 RepID=UPI0010AA9BC5|nr:DUF6362 family protein [Nitratireductor sp. XY-223]
MSANPQFEDWTAKAVEHRVVEAAETLALCPRALGPKAFGNAMPEPLRRQIDAYASNAPRYRRRPSAGAIDRMEACWAWINALEDEAERRLLYDWARAKCGRGRSLHLLAQLEGVSGRTLRREITRICTAIASSLNRAHLPWQGGPVEPARGSGAEARKRAETPKYSTHWRTSEARPEIDPSLPPSRTLRRWT